MAVRRILLAIFTLMFCQLAVVSLNSYGDHCDADCDERLGLTCNQVGVCECMNTNATLFDPKRGRCVSRVGWPCFRFGNETFCVENAQCENVNFPCQCKHNFFQTRNGTCSPTAKYGDSCSAKKPCDKASGIECVEKKCHCKYPKDQAYNSKERKCISFAGGNCSFTLPCVKNAECDQDIFELRSGKNVHGKTYFYNATVGRKCSCQLGFTETKARECLASFGHFCNSTQPCNSEQNLDCIDDVCMCTKILHQYYDATNFKKCINLVGTKCSTTTNNNENSDCVQNSKCVDGKCQCVSGYSETPMKTCMKDNQQNCKAKECNVYAGLACKNGVCRCVDEFLEYDNDKNACLSVGLGSPCGKLSFPNSDNNVFIHCKNGFKCSNYYGSENENVKSICVRSIQKTEF